LSLKRKRWFEIKEGRRKTRRLRKTPEMLSDERCNMGKGSSLKALRFVRLAFAKVQWGTLAVAEQAAYRMNPTMLRGNELSRDFRREDPDYPSTFRVETRLPISLLSACIDYPFARTYRSTTMKQNLENASSLDEIFYFEKK
jgi:hypothetical protein